MRRVNITAILFLIAFVTGFVVSNAETTTKEVEIGQELKLTAKTGFPDAEIRWFKDGELIEGETGFVFLRDAAQSTDAGIYYCEVTGPCSTKESNKVEVAVEFPEFFTEDKNTRDGMAGAVMLWQNEPNPVHSSTTIKFLLPESQQVRLSLINTYGEEVAVLAEDLMNQGVHTVDINVTDMNLSSGTYFYTLQTQGHKETKSLVIVK
ncbi:MAG: T9SS type A sorting domain-containing protein [Candidatus Kapaibacterium sp.]